MGEALVAVPLEVAAWWLRGAAWLRGLVVEVVGIGSVDGKGRADRTFADGTTAGEDLGLFVDVYAGVSDLQVSWAFQSLGALDWSLGRARQAWQNRGWGPTSVVAGRFSRAGDGGRIARKITRRRTGATQS